MRLMSFFLTVPELLAGMKNVTRRMGWEGLRDGASVMAVDKAQGLRRPNVSWRMGQLHILGVTRQRLDLIAAADVTSEGFPGMSADEFIDKFCRFNKSAGCKPDSPITRIEFRPALPQETDLLPMGSPARWDERGGEQHGHVIGMVPANHSPAGFISRTRKALKAEAWTLDPDETRPGRSLIVMGVDGRIAWPSAVQMSFGPIRPLRDTLLATGALKSVVRHIAFTLGNRSGYRKRLAETKPVFKLGRAEDYPGGSVWATPDQVWSYIDSVDLPYQAECYEIELLMPFGECTAPSSFPEASWRDLLINALIIREMTRPTIGAIKETT